MKIVAIESKHENRSDRMFSGICEPQYNELYVGKLGSAARVDERENKLEINK